MAETLVNGEARAEVRVVAARLEDCQARCEKADDRNREDHSRLFTKLDEVSASVSDLRTSFREGAAKAAILGVMGLTVLSAAIQLLFRVLVK